MTEIVILTSIIVVGISIFLWNRAAGTLNILRLNLISWPFYQLYLITLISIPLAANINMDELTKVSYNFYRHPSTVIFVWLSVLWMYFSMPMSSLVTLYIKKRKLSLTPIINNFLAQELILSKKKIVVRKFMLSYLMILVIVLGITTYSVARLGTSPLLILLQTGDYALKQHARSSVFVTGKENSLISLVFSFFNTLPWFSYLLFSLFYLKIKIPFLKVIFGITFLLSLIYYSLSTKITPVIFYLLSFSILRSLIVRPKYTKKISILVLLKYLTLFSLLFSLLIIILILLFSFFKGLQNKTIIDIFYENVIERICLGQLVGTFLSKEVFPDQHPFLYFSSTGKLINQLFNNPSNPSYGKITMSFYDPSGVAKGLAGHMTSNYLAEAWANFGYMGIILSPIYIGAIIQILNLWFLNRDKTVFSIATYTFIASNLTYSSELIPFYYPLQLSVQLLGFYCIGKILRLV